MFSNIKCENYEILGPFGYNLSFESQKLGSICPANVRMTRANESPFRKALPSFEFHKTKIQGLNISLKRKYHQNQYLSFNLNTANLFLNFQNGKLFIFVQVQIVRRLQLKEMQKEKRHSRLDSIKQNLRERWSLNNIHNEIELIISMNRHLEIMFDRVKNLEILSKLTKEEVLQIIRGIPFLKVIKKNSSKQEYVQIQYENARKLILVTGIHRPFIEEMVSKFNNHYRRQYDQGFGKSPSAKIINNNHYWITIQTSSEDAAASLKKYLRSEKRIFDEDQKKTNYKIENRRIRIVIVKEDLFTLLIDAMTQYKAQMFHKNFMLFPHQLLERRKSQEVSSSPTVQASKFTILYQPLIFNNNQNYSAKNEQREQQFSDGFSQSNSLNSEIIDASKMKDIIQTSDQGIQSQNNLALQTDNLQSIVHSQAVSVSLPNIYQQFSQIKEKEVNSDQIPKQVEQDSQKQELTYAQNVQKNKKSTYKAQMSIQKERQDLLCTEKHSPIYKKGQFNETTGQTSDINKQASSQTQQTLYTLISNPLMRRLMQQFKNRNHSQLVQLPEWMKSQSENQRNRHRFFSSLCKPKLIRQRKIQ